FLYSRPNPAFEMTVRDMIPLFMTVSRWFFCLFIFLAYLNPTMLAAQNRAATIAYQFSHAAVMDPTFSPDGKEMVYIMVIAGKEQLMRRTLDGSSVRQLTSDEASHEDPAWSPDGKRVAFVLIKDKL